MLNVSKKEFRRKIEAGLNSRNANAKEDDLPHDMIDNLTADVESDDESLEADINEKAKSLANEIKEDTENKSVSQSSSDNGKEYFQVDVEIDGQVRGVKFRGHIGIEITGFECSIETKSNAAVYNKCEVFLGNKDDNFEVWGKYVGEMKEPVNGRKEASFEFYLRGNNLTITYWRSHRYQDKAKVMAKRAITLIKQVIK